MRSRSINDKSDADQLAEQLWKCVYVDAISGREISP